MEKRISHTIRFDEDTKKRIQEIAVSQNRKFQEQMDHMIAEQLKNDEVVYFLNRVRCRLEAVGEMERQVLMAKIASLVDMES